MNSTDRLNQALQARGLTPQAPKVLGMGLLQVLVNRPDDKPKTPMPLTDFHAAVADAVTEAGLVGPAINYFPTFPRDQMRIVWKEDAAPAEVVEDEPEA
jgi:hypothetical protein